MTDWRKRALAIACVGLLASLAAPAMAETDSEPAAEVKDEPAAEAEEEPAAEEPNPLRLNRLLDRASDFAPVGVLLDHTHDKGDWTFLFRYSQASRRNLLAGTVPVSVGAVTNTSANCQGATPVPVSGRYCQVPITSTRSTYTMGAMYAPRDRLTFALLLPLVTNHLEQWTWAGAKVDDTIGIGDAKLLFLIPFIQKGDELTQFNFGISFPTGSIQQKDANGQRLPYTMQLGSGSWDAIWGITYTGEFEAISWGGQFESQYRISDNSIGYRLGTVYHASAWVSGGISDWVSVSARFAWTRVGNIHGVDPTLDKTLTPLNDNMKQGGTTLQVGPGLNVLLPFAGGQRLAVELVFPVYEDLDGPQLASDMTIIAGWQWLF